MNTAGRLGQGYRSMVRKVGPLVAAAITAGAALLVLLLCLGLACLIGVRKTSPALQHGDYREVPTNRDDVFAFLRSDTGSGERVLVIASFAHAATSTTLDLASIGITAATAHERIFGSALPAITPANAAAYPVPLAAQGAIWIALQ